MPPPCPLPNLITPPVYNVLHWIVAPCCLGWKVVTALPSLVKVMACLVSNDNQKRKSQPIVDGLGIRIAARLPLPKFHHSPSDDVLHLLNSLLPLGKNISSSLIKGHCMSYFIKIAQHAIWMLSQHSTFDTSGVQSFYILGNTWGKHLFYYGGFIIIIIFHSPYNYLMLQHT